MPVVLQGIDLGLCAKQVNQSTIVHQHRGALQHLSDNPVHMVNFSALATIALVVATRTGRQVDRSCVDGERAAADERRLLGVLLRGRQLLLLAGVVLGAEQVGGNA